MLFLKRKIGQSICIGDDIFMTITSNNGEEVQIAFDAPKEVKIHREEIYRANKRKQEDESVSPSDPVLSELIKHFKAQREIAMAS